MEEVVEGDGDSEVESGQGKGGSMRREEEDVMAGVSPAPSAAPSAAPSGAGAAATAAAVSNDEASVGGEAGSEGVGEEDSEAGRGGDSERSVEDERTAAEMEAQEMNMAWLMFGVREQVSRADQVAHSFDVCITRNVSFSNPCSLSFSLSYSLTHSLSYPFSPSLFVSLFLSTSLSPAISLSLPPPPPTLPCLFSPQVQSVLQAGMCGDSSQAEEYFLAVDRLRECLAGMQAEVQRSKLLMGDAMTRLARQFDALLGAVE